MKGQLSEALIMSFTRFTSQIFDLKAIASRSGRRGFHHFRSTRCVSLDCMMININTHLKHFRRLFYPILFVCITTRFRGWQRSIGYIYLQCIDCFPSHVFLFRLFTPCLYPLFKCFYSPEPSRLGPSRPSSKSDGSFLGKFKDLIGAAGPVQLGGR